VREEKAWMEMVIVQPPPPPPPIEPEIAPPEPEPPKPPKKEVVKFEDTSPVPPAPSDVPPPNAKKVTRLVQGLSNDSFVTGSTSGFTVRAGNSTATGYRPGEVASPNDVSAQGVVAYQSVAVAPKIERRPMLHVPDELKAAGIVGKVSVELTIGDDGRVTEVRIVDGLHPAADASCVHDLKQTRWKPGLRDGTPVTVTGVPFTCRYEVLDP
jgi:protein TonB